MSKKWIDANEITMIHELPNRKLRDIDFEMRKKPNFDKVNNKKMNNYIVKRREKLISSKEKIIKEYDKKIKRLDKYIKVLNKSEIKDSDNFETVVYKLYMQLDNVSLVAKEIDKLGYRIITDSWQGKRKYSSNDITFIITDKEANVDEELKEVVQEIQKVNYGKSSKRWF